MRPVLAAVLLCLAGLAKAQDEPRLALAEYREELGRIEAALRSGDLDDARTRTRALREARVSFGDETLAADPTVLAPVEGVADSADAARQAKRVGALVRALDELPPDAAAAVDRARLERVRRQQAAAAIPKGGEVAQVTVRPLPLPERAWQALADLADWIADTAHRFWEWLRKWIRKLWPRSERPDEAAGLGLNVTVLLMVAAVTALLAVLAIRALRQSRGDADEVASAPFATSARDADPLSREADEWARYAAELAAAGRRREAIRAWYHAVLVTLFRAGTLHFHRGRTNWEYAALLPPEAAWRPAFLEITRSFDREWYGRDTSAPEALQACAAAARGILRALRAGEPA